jgi:hypothetical protein
MQKAVDAVNGVLSSLSQISGMSVENINSRTANWERRCHRRPPPRLKRRPGKENDMDWNAIFFAVVLPCFIVGAIGLGVYAQRLPG